MEKPRAVLDACILYPAPVRDFLMECAVADFFEPRWSEAIHDEWLRNLQAKRPDLSAARLIRTRDLMDRAAPQALVMNYEHLIPTLSLPDPDDRHVLAAALHSGARVLVTFNLRHFPASALAPLGIIAQHPDDFLAGLVKAQEDDFVEMARLHRARLLNPPKNSAAYIATLRQSQLMQVADLLTRRISDI